MQYTSISDATISKATLNPKFSVRSEAEIGPTVSPTPKNELKYPEATLFNSSPLRSGLTYSIVDNISGKIGTVTMHAENPNRITPIKMVMWLSGNCKMGDVPIINTAKQKIMLPYNKVFLRPNVLHHNGTNGVFIM